MTMTTDADKLKEKTGTLLEEIDRNQFLLSQCKPLTDFEIKQTDKYNLIHNTYSSNSVEGNSFTLLETSMWLSDGLTVNGKTRNELLEVEGHGNAFRDMLRIARKNSIDYIAKNLLIIIQDLHSTFYKLINFQYAGVYRDFGVRIEQASFTPPGPNELLARMDNFWKSFPTDVETLHPVLLAASAHLKLARIHPFCDGNGRISRLLMNLLLVNGGYQIINIDKDIRFDYYAALDKSWTQAPDNNSFLCFIAEHELKTQKSYMEFCKYRETSAPCKKNPKSQKP